MLFRRLAIRGYRSIVKADLKLGEITIIIGPSDTGKSNLVRAIRDWAYNATGTDFITEGMRVTRIAVVVGRDTKVVWEKHDRGTSETGGKTRYFLQKAPPPGVEPTTLVFEKVGRVVPVEITDITGIRSVQVDEDLQVRPNVVEQAEPWFLLTNPPWTPGKVTKVVGKVSGIDALVLGNTDLVRRKAASLRETRSLRERANEKRGELAEFVRLDDAVNLAGRAAAEIAKASQARFKLDRAVSLLESIKRGRERVAAARALVGSGRKALAEIDALGLPVLWAKLASAEGATAKVSTLTQRRASILAKMASDRLALKAARKLLSEISKDQGLTCPLCGEKAHQECRQNLQDEAANEAGTTEES